MNTKLNTNMDDNFLNLLKSVADNYTFDCSLFNPEEGKFLTSRCKCLTMADLNQIIEASLDDSSMQVGFYTTITKILKKSLTTDKQYNIIDRLLYILQTRAKSVASTKIFTEEDSHITIDFDKLVYDLQQGITKNAEWFSPKIHKNDNITIVCDIPTIEGDVLAGEQFYKHFTVNVDNEDDIKLFIGQNFMIELTKCVKSITIEDSTLEFSTLSFEDRLKAIEEIPTFLMQDVINYNKNYKKIVNACLTIEDFILPINGSLFLQ